MLMTIGAKIAFLIWVLLEVALTGLAFKVMKLWGFVLGSLSTAFIGYLLYTQNWTVFLYYVLIVAAISPLVPGEKERFHQSLTVSRYAFVLAVTYAVDFGAYGIIHLLNK